MSGATLLTNKVNGNGKKLILLGKFSLELTCRVTAAFCACASDVCTQKTIYRKFKLIWFKPHDFSMKVMINKTKQMLFSRIFEKTSSLLALNGGGRFLSPSSPLSSLLCSLVS